MAIRLTVDVVIDVDEWDEATRADRAMAVRAIMETYSMRIADALSASEGCDVHGWRPVYRADGAMVGSWTASSAEV